MKELETALAIRARARADNPGASQDTPSTGAAWSGSAGYTAVGLPTCASSRTGC